MARQYDDDEEEFGPEADQLPESVKRLLRDLRDQVKSAHKESADTKKELESYRQRERQASVAKVLEAKGINQKFARFVLTEVEDPTEDAVSKWLSDNADLVGLQPEEPQTSVPEETVQAHTRIVNATTNGKPLTISESIATQIAEAKTPEELHQILASAKR